MTLFFLPVFSQFLHGFAAVAAVAQALQIVRIGKQSHVAFVIHDVVNFLGPDSQPSRAAAPAERFLCQLHGTKVLCPNLQLVQLVPLSGFLAAVLDLSGFVCIAIAVCYQLTASRMPTRPKRLASHGLSPPWPKQNAGANNTRSLAMLLAPAFNALAFFDV